MTDQSSGAGEQPIPTDAISAKIEDGQTITFRPSAVLAILTKEDRSRSTILLQGGMKVPIKGSAEGLRKRVFGTAPKNAAKAPAQPRAAVTETADGPD